MPYSRAGFLSRILSFAEALISPRSCSMRADAALTVAVRHIAAENDLAFANEIEHIRQNFVFDFGAEKILPRLMYSITGSC